MDHVRERFFVASAGVRSNGFITAPGPVFFSRLAAHLCAPVFVFLTGLSAWLYQQQRVGAPRPLRRFLLKRGLFLIALELTLVNFAWMGSYHTPLAAGDLGHWLEYVGVGLVVSLTALGVSCDWFWLGIWA